MKNLEREELIKTAGRLATQVADCSILMTDARVKKLDALINNLSVVLMMHKDTMEHYLNETDEENLGAIENKHCISQTAKLDLINLLTQI